MSYIINSTNPFISLKVTSLGREKLAQGLLNFSFWGIGDSELNYNREGIIDPLDITLSATSKIMKPFDIQPNIKSFITPSLATTPFQSMTPANLNVIKAIVNNEAVERGFFSVSGDVYTTLTANTYSPYTEIINTSSISGGTTFNLVSTSQFSVGDLVLIKLTNNTIGNIIPNENDRAVPNLWFKINSKTSTSVTLDRNLPNFSGFSTTSEVIIYRGGEVYDTIATGNTTAYWDSGTLSFDSASNVTCHDVPVWNMNNVWCEDLAGVTGLTTTKLYEDYTKFGSFPYLGTKNPYLEYVCASETGDGVDCALPGVSVIDGVSKSVSIIHFTNNSISSLYGEFLFIDTTNSKTLRIQLPDLMYHRRNASTASGTSMGMTFVATGSTNLVGTSDIEYVNLIEDPSLISSASTPMVIGRVYPQLKTIVIHDDEIVAALSYKSNRNWTLPALSADLASPSGGTSTGLLGINETMYLTYSLENNSLTGLTSSLPNQKYIKITNNTSSAKDIAFKISGTDLLPYMRKLEAIDYDGYGFYANKFKLVYQIVSASTTTVDIRPDAGSWKVYDFTTTALTTTSTGTIDPKLLENQSPITNGFILNKINDATSTTFSLVNLINYAATNSPSSLQFGDEKFFYGNLTTFIGATIYKTIFDLTISSSQFTDTTNPTRSKDLTTLPPNIKVSEVGIYDADKNLVCIGKLSTPVELDGSTIMLELSLDF